MPTGIYQHKPQQGFQRGHQIKSMLGKHHSKETKQKISRSRKGKFKGKNHPNWKGNNVAKEIIHSWINRNYGKPKYCEICKRNDGQ